MSLGRPLVKDITYIPTGEGSLPTALVARKTFASVIVGYAFSPDRIDTIHSLPALVVRRRSRLASSST